MTCKNLKLVAKCKTMKNKPMKRNYVQTQNSALKYIIEISL